METIQNYQEKRASLNAEIDHVLAQLEVVEKLLENNYTEIIDLLKEP